MYAKVTFQQGLPENAHTVVASFGDPSGRLDRDFSARDIRCRNLYASENVEAKRNAAADTVVVREAVRSENFITGFTGAGFRILADGSAEMRRLTLHEVLEVPEMRYNRITAVGGQLWVASAGKIRIVTDNMDGTWRVEFKLEEGEAHEFAKDDILRAVFHTGTGLRTGYYRVVESLSDSAVRAQVVEGIAPQPEMAVARTGNYSDCTRQNSIYLDGYHGYERVLTGVDSPQLRPENVIYQAGKLDGLTTESFGALKGVGVYCGNLYAAGVLRVRVDGEEKDVGTEFKVQADLIQSKVSQTEFDALSGTVGEHATQIAQTAQAISLKAESSEVDELGNRLTTAEASIRVTSEAITQTVRKGDVISSINQSAEEVKIEASRIRLVGDTTLEGLFSAGRIKAEYIDADNLVARKLSTGESGARIEINHEANVISIKNAAEEEIFKVGPYAGTGDDPYLRVGTSVRIGQFGIGTGRIHIGEDTIAFGGPSRLDLMTMEIRSPNGYDSPDPTTIWIQNLPAGRTTDANIQALKAGTIFIDTGQNANNCCTLRIKV